MSRPTIDREALVAALTAYVPRARQDAKRPTSLRGVAAELGVPKSTLADYAGVAGVAVLLDDLREIRDTRHASRRALEHAGEGARAARAKRAPVTPEAAPDEAGAWRPAATPYDQALLVTAYQEAAERAANAMQRFIGRHRQYRHPSDLPLVVRDRERTTREVGRTLADLLEVNETWLASQAHDTVTEPPGEVLALPLESPAR